LHASEIHLALAPRADGHGAPAIEVIEPVGGRAVGCAIAVATQDVDGGRTESGKGPLSREDALLATKGMQNVHKVATLGQTKREQAMEIAILDALDRRPSGSSSMRRYSRGAEGPCAIITA
jgi:hypothetical protein